MDLNITLILPNQLLVCILDQGLADYVQKLATYFNL